MKSCLSSLVLSSSFTDLVVQKRKGWSRSQKKLCCSVLLLPSGLRIVDIKLRLSELFGVYSCFPHYRDKILYLVCKKNWLTICTESHLFAVYKLTCFIHLSLLWNNTFTDGWTTRSVGVRTLLKVTESGSFFPSAVTASVTVKLCFSAPQNSRKLFCRHWIQEFDWMVVQTASVCRPCERFLIGNNRDADGMWLQINGTWLLLLQIFWEMLSECCFDAKADRLAALPFLVPAKGRFKLAILTEFFCL